MNFKVPTTAEDIAGEKLADDIRKEQDKLKEADLVIFQFPMYWFSVPAILKGWMDGVLTKGFAYTDEQGFAEGLFNGTKALLSFTTGSQESMFSMQDVNGDIKDTLCPILQATLCYCGFNVLEPHIFRSPSCVTDAERRDMLAAWQDRIQEELLPAQLKPEISQKASESGASSKSKDLKRAGM
ncbi:ribosyldihydronicotinamide dehydrogenase [quinone]-like [Nelusetta ayraudi]|uniref:ribosyldihydronicotinamide dehydrogenase [quinone]-like n=1 Tax=Nelusetta ayraudi TaxID=303726 RepID=UPI003F72878E